MKNGNPRKVVFRNNSERHSIEKYSASNHSNTHIESYLRPKFCRICTEIGDSEFLGDLIAPCRCEKLYKLVHEECLKTFLISLQEDLNDIRCHVCKEKFKMSFQYKKKLRFKLIFALEWQYRLTIFLCILSWLLCSVLLPLLINKLHIPY